MLEKVRQGRSTQEELEWHNEMCEFNIKHGMFVPVAMRRKLAHLKPAPAWSCKKCGTTKAGNQDKVYKNYCVSCADDIRLSRKLPAYRKTRSDKNSTHLKPYEQRV